MIRNLTIDRPRIIEIQNSTFCYIINMIDPRVATYTMRGRTHVKKSFAPDYLHPLHRYDWQLRHLSNKAISS